MKNAIVFLAPGFEETEAVTAIDMLRRANIQVTVAGISDTLVTGSHGIALVAEKKLVDVKETFDACVLPGGMPGATNLAASPLVKERVAKMFSDGKLVAAICAAPAVVLAPWGILNNRTATCYSGMQTSFPPNARYVTDPVVVDENLITSRGAATALLFALAIIEKLAGREMKEKIVKATQLPG